MSKHELRQLEQNLMNKLRNAESKLMNKRDEIAFAKWGQYNIVPLTTHIAQHAGDFYKLTEKQIAGAKFFDTSGMSLQAQRKMEQLLINANGGVKALANRINSSASGFWEQLGIPKP